MAKKFYAVKSGYTPGVYDTWEECKKQVSGYLGAIYKGFSTLEEAMEYISGSTTDKPESVQLSESEAVAYVDGSYDSERKIFSYGVVMLYGGREEYYSGSMTSPDLVSMRNVAGEIKAAEFAMRFAAEKHIKSIDIYHDYEGIARWCTGEWKANKTGTQAYKKFYDDLKKDVQINFIKVKGHSGNKYNDIADQLAKQAIVGRKDR